MAALLAGAGVVCANGAAAGVISGTQSYFNVDYSYDYTDENGDEVYGDSSAQFAANGFANFAASAEAGPGYTKVASNISYSSSRDDDVNVAARGAAVNGSYVDESQLYINQIYGESFSYSQISERVVINSPGTIIFHALISGDASKLIAAGNGALSQFNVELGVFQFGSGSNNYRDYYDFGASLVGTGRRFGSMSHTTISNNTVSHFDQQSNGVGYFGDYALSFIFPYAGTYDFVLSSSCDTYVSVSEVHDSQQSASCSFDKSTYWNGISAAYDLAGNPVAVPDLIGESGFNYHYASPLSPDPFVPAPVPAPPVAGLFWLGALIAAARRRRR